jgi:hypothetical protein
MYCPQGQQGYTHIFLIAPALLTCGQTINKIRESLMENIGSSGIPVVCADLAQANCA